MIISKINQKLTNKETEIQQLSEENTTFRQTICKLIYHNLSLASQNDRFKEKIDEMFEEKSHMEEEINRLIGILRENQTQIHNDQGKIIPLKV